MIELTRCYELIKQFERLHKLKVHKIPLEYFDGRRVLLLMCKCSGVWTDLPFCSEGYVQTCEEEGAKYPFKFVESQDGNLFCSKNIKWQIRDTRVWSNNVYADKVNFRINIDCDNPITNPDVRRKIHKAQSLGIEVRQGKEELLKDLYKVYVRRMYELGSPASGKSALLKWVRQPNHTFFVAYHNQKPIGVATLSQRDSQSCENGLFSTDIRYNKLYPSYLLHHSMITYAQNQGMKAYYFGRSTRGSSVYRYKMHYRPTEVQLYWSSSYPAKNIRQNGLAKKLWRLLPFWLAKLIGPIINKYIY